MRGWRCTPARVAAFAAFAAVALFGVGGARAAPTARSLLERARLTVGEGVDWVVVLENAGAAAPEPEFASPDWARVQAVGTSRNMSMVNGRFSSSTNYRFLLVPTRQGRHSIPAVGFRIGSTRVTSEPLTVDVLPPLSGTVALKPGGSRLRLVATLDKNRAVVGQPVRLTVRFYQGVRLRSDPQYRAPEVAGFWAEPATVPRSYYAEEGGARWLVSETSVVLYPTVAGRLEVGTAKMLCEPGDGGPPEEADPFAGLLGGGAGSGEVVEVESQPLFLEAVAPPGEGRPAGYRGAVGDFALTVSAPRARVRADETLDLTVRLSGTGDLRLAAQPGWPPLDDFEVYSRSARDSVDLEGGEPRGTKVVEFSLLARRRGRLVVPALEYATYVPGEGYRILRSAPLEIAVEAPLAEVGGARALSPLEVPRGVDLPPGAWPGWLAALIGGGAAVLAAAWIGRGRRSSGREAVEEEVRQARAGLLAARARGDLAAYYGEAERLLAGPASPGESAAGSEAEGESARRLLLARAQAARYAPGGPAEAVDAFGESMERHLAARVSRARSGARQPAGRWAILAACGLVALGGAGYGAWRSAAGGPSAEVLSGWRAATRSLTAGEGAGAAATLAALWEQGWRGGPLAAQCALAELGQRRLGPAALWAERARRESPRDPFVRAVRRVLDEEGALPGHPEGLGTVLTWREAALWAALAWALGAAVWGLASLSAGLRRRIGRGVALSLAATTILAAGVSFGVWRAGFAERGAVVMDPGPLRASPGGRETLDLEPGRLVEFREASGEWVRVGLGGGLEGWLPADHLGRVEKGAGR